MAEKYILRISAGSDYDESKHVEVPVNSPKTIKISSENADIDLNIRIKDYHGLPRGSPAISPYFETEPHSTNQDQYSIAFRFTPKKSKDVSEEEAEGNGINGVDLQFGNDFDHAIRDKLPPGFNTAMSIVKWWIDPGLDGDAYADKPYLYGPALSSINTIHVGSGEYDGSKGGLWFEEGGNDEGIAIREEANMPADSKARMKWALNDSNKEQFTFNFGTTYGMDFFNPYLDFANLALRLPGFHLPIDKYWDGQGLRYVLRNKSTGAVYLVIVFTLYMREDLNEDGTLKEGAESRIADAEHSADDEQHEQHDSKSVLKKAKEKLEKPLRETSADDVD